MTTFRESAFLDWISKKALKDSGLVGDDCAVLSPPKRDQLVTTDMLMQGSCFLLDDQPTIDSLIRLGNKAMAINLSDIAAMGGRPTTAFIALGLPRTFSLEQAQALFLGMKEMADRHRVTIGGGDTNVWNGELTISVTVLGEALGEGPVRRSGAKVGDQVFVTGDLGGSILGKHLDFEPRVPFAHELMSALIPHALIDISDGFSLDLERICSASGVGAEIDANKVPISDAARRMSDSRSALQHALEDGEDFELIVVVDPKDVNVLLQIRSVPLTEVGRIVKEGLWLVSNGKREVLKGRGYEHGGI